MESNKLEHSYQEQLVRVGVEPTKAQQAAKNLSTHEFQLIGEIWPEWATIFKEVTQTFVDKARN
jgi:hypothetical protein